MPAESSGYGADWGTDWGGGDYDLSVQALVKSRLITALREVPWYFEIASYIAEQLQTMDEILQVVRHHSGEATAVGKTIDRHGAGVLQPREGLGDYEYRKTVIAAGAALFREQTTELALDVLRILVTDTNTTGVYRDWMTSAYEYTLTGITTARAALWDRVLRRAKPDTISMHTKVVEVEALAFGLDDGGLGLDQGRFAYTLDGD